MIKLDLTYIWKQRDRSAVQLLHSCSVPSFLFRSYKLLAFLCDCMGWFVLVLVIHSEILFLVTQLIVTMV